MIEIHPVEGIGEIRAGDDLGAILAAALAGRAPVSGDILVVTQKIFSKAEGRMVDLATVTPGEPAIELAHKTKKDARLVELVLSESAAVVRAKAGVLITRHKLGFVMANSGIDCSNIGKGGGDYALLLPSDPDGSAARLQASLFKRLGIRMGIVMSDSFGRPWRNGVVNVAIGAAGLPAIHDKRGMPDRDGRILQVTQIAYGDLFASAAGLLMGEADEGVPAVLVRGCPLPDQEVAAAKLIRPLEEDLFQ
jgi:coenzyme F420-0:L-glutamate ligase/coenzyme F420-1:gamma-L-glutamate ligase